MNLESEVHRKWTLKITWIAGDLHNSRRLNLKIQDINFSQESHKFAGVLSSRSLSNRVGNTEITVVTEIIEETL